MASKTIDYALTYFEKVNLDKIKGRPDYPQLHRLFQDLKANASKVPSELGGGLYGHLGLVMSAVAYTTISADAYVRPAMPAPLVIPPGSTQHQATRLREDWREAKDLFRETVDLENALKKQLIEAIDDEYLQELRNPVTNSITQPIAQVITHLFDRYGEVTQATLDEALHKVKNMNLSLKIDSLSFH